MCSHSRTMIVIEDNPKLVRLFCDMFLQTDVHLVFLTSDDLCHLGDIIDEHQPIVVIMDYMTIISAYDSVINTIPLYIPTVLLTPIEESKFAIHVDYCLKQPFAPSQIYAIMKHITERIR